MHLCIFICTFSYDCGLTFADEVFEDLQELLSMYKEKFRQKTGLPLLNAVGADDCTDGLDVADKLNELVYHFLVLLNVKIRAGIILSLHQAHAHVLFSTRMIGLLLKSSHGHTVKSLLPRHGLKHGPAGVGPTDCGAFELVSMAMDGWRQLRNDWLLLLHHECVSRR